jgi:hypothetical protein
LLRLEANLNAAVVHAQRVDSNRFGGWLAQNTAVTNIERGTVKRTTQTKCPQSPSFELRHRMRALVLDGEEFAPGVTDQNVVAGYLERPAAAVGNVRNISQFSKIAVIQTFCLPQVWNGYRNID